MENNWTIIYYNQAEVGIKLLINKKWQVTFGLEYILF